VDNILVIGGRLRSAAFRKLEEWQSCDQALVIDLDLAKNESKPCVEYISPPEVCPPHLPAMLFKSATIKENKLYTCTSTEILVYELPSYRLVHYVSLPCFNDLHHAYPSQAGTILAAVTGLDMVVEVTTEGKVLREWSVIDADTWARFSRQTDYRLVPTTKPHRSHPNHVFELNGEIWVTRFQQQDAICLTKAGPRIELTVARPHDGYIFGDKIYFTTVDGHVIMADQKTLKVEQTIDLNQMSGQTGQVLGWCRGVLPLDERRVWVGFTRVRPTKFVENVAWIKHGGSRHRPSHIALYDLERKACELEIALEPHGVGIVFSLLPTPEPRISRPSITLPPSTPPPSKGAR
jgi:hypothetical protein